MSLQDGVGLTWSDLGERDGRLIVFGGPYSNLQALDALLAIAREREITPDNMICTGDIVAYCADGAACVSRIADLGIAVVAGNCEIQLAEAADDCGCGFDSGTTCDLLSKRWYAHAQATINADARAYFADLPTGLLFRHAGKRYAVIHGGVSDVARFLWPVSSGEAFHAELTLLENQVGPVDVVIAGHCGIAFQRHVGGVHWINAGTIGMPPNDGRPETRFLTIKNGTPAIEVLTYDHSAASRAMVSASLTQGYDQALITGHWPSEDVLPESMRRTRSAI